MIKFYNHFGFGDIFISREFVRQICKYFDVPTEFSTYYHNKDFKFFIDIPMQERQIESLMSPSKFTTIVMRPLGQVEQYFENYSQILIDIPLKKESTVAERINTFKLAIREDGDIYINTWIGRNPKYVLPGIACTIKNYIQMYRDIGILIPQDDWLYIPSINFVKIYEHKKNPFLNINEHCVLICNGDVLSNQSKNFDFTPIVEALAKTHTDRTFVLTKKVSINLDNVLYTDDFTGGKDLFDIAWLSENKCDVIVGRSSGPFVFCQTKNNYLNPEKRIISFTHTKECAHAYFDAKAKLYWSNDFSFDNVYKFIEGAL